MEDWLLMYAASLLREHPKFEARLEQMGVSLHAFIRFGRLAAEVRSNLAGSSEHGNESSDTRGSHASVAPDLGETEAEHNGIANHSSYTRGGCTGDQAKG